MIEITAEADLFVPPRVRLAVTGSGSLATATAPITVYRVHTDGTVWPVIMADDERMIVSGHWVGFDYHSPYRCDVSYYAKINTQTSPIVNSWLPSDQTWLIPASLPANALQCHYVSELAKTRTMPQRIGVYTVEGSRYPIVRTEATVGPLESEIVFGVRAEKLDALMNLFGESKMLLLNTPARKGWDIHWLWIQPKTVTIDNPSAPTYPRGMTGYKYRECKLQYIEMSQPDVDLVPIWNWDCVEVDSTLPTLTALESVFPTCDDLQLNYRTG